MNFSPIYKQRINQVVVALRERLTPGILVVLTGISEEKSYRLVEALGDSAEFVSVSKYLSSALLEMPRTRRALKAIQFLGEKAAKGPTLFYDLELLFDPGMGLDVLPALKTLAKGRELYLDWPGEMKVPEALLTFADPGDPAYREYALTPDLGVVDFSGETYPAFEI